MCSRRRMLLDLHACDGAVREVGALTVCALLLLLCCCLLQGKQLVFVTNNSTKSRAGYLGKFTGLGLNVKAVSACVGAAAAATAAAVNGVVEGVGEGVQRDGAFVAAVCCCLSASADLPPRLFDAGGDLLVVLCRRRVPRLHPLP